MSERLRIGMIAACPFPWPRGTPIRIFRMAEFLAARGHDVHLFTYHLGQPADDAPFLIHRIPDAPGYTRTAPGPTLRKLLQLNPRLARLVARFEQDKPFDIIHAHHYEGILTATRAAARAPIVYDAHTTLAGELPYYYPWLPAWATRWVGSWLDRRLPRRAQHTIAVSSRIRDSLIAVGAASSQAISVIPNGVRWRLFDVTSAPRQSANKLIFTGNLSNYQGIGLMLRAFAELWRRRPDVRLLLVTHSSFASFEDLARKLEILPAIDVRAAPFCEQPALLAEADVAINPRTDCDGIPQKLLNYMAAGKPIVSFDGSAVHLQHDRTGLRVPDGDTSAMARAIERLLDDPALASRLGAAARQEVKNRFSWEVVAQRVEQVYQRLLERSPRVRR